MWSLETICQVVKLCQKYFLNIITVGCLTGQIQFPSWLGKNSKKSKVDRILQELQMHTSLSAGVSKGSLALDYGQVLRDHIISPLLKKRSDGVDQAVANMVHYSLLREDLDGLMEVTSWPNKPQPFVAVGSKVKSLFSRKLNKVGTDYPYSITNTVGKKKSGGGGGGGPDLLPGDEEEEDDKQEDCDTFEKDESIMMN